MVSIGDVVTVRQFPGERWAVLGPDVNGIPPGRRWRLRSGGNGYVAGDGDIIVVHHPQFDAGQHVKYRGEDALVVRDDGNTVRVSYCAYRPRALDRHDGLRRIRTKHLCESVIDRGELVAENL